MRHCHAGTYLDSTLVSLLGNVNTTAYTDLYNCVFPNLGQKFGKGQHMGVMVQSNLDQIPASSHQCGIAYFPITECPVVFCPTYTVHVQEILLIIYGTTL